MMLYRGIVTYHLQDGVEFVVVVVVFVVRLVDIWRLGSRAVYIHTLFLCRLTRSDSQVDESMTRF